MDFVAARSWADALAVKSERPQAKPICGGTDLMVEINFYRSRPDTLLDLSQLDELATWDRLSSAIAAVLASTAEAAS